MKLYKLSLMALALAGVMVACSDDKYTPGAASPGAYFPTTLGEVVELTEGASSVDVPVYRASSSGTATATFEYVDETGMFTPASTTISFADGSNQSAITFNYDASKIKLEQKYNMSINITEGGSIYGTTDYSFAFMLPAVLVGESFGTGDYTYDVALKGTTDSGLPVDKMYKETDPDDVTFVVHHWGFDVDLKIKCDFKVKNPDGTHPIVIDPQPIGYISTDNGPLYISIDWMFQQELGHKITDADKTKNNYNPETGLFKMFVAYYYPDTRDDEGVLWAGNGWEYMQMSGYPDYSIYINYNGIYTDPYGKASYAMGTITTGPDFDQVKVALVDVETDINTAVEKIMKEEIRSLDVDAGADLQEFQLKIPYSGTYNIIAVGIVAGEAIVVESTTFLAGSWVVESGNWEDVGTATFEDGWIMPAFVRNGIPMRPNKYPYEVKIQRDMDNEYRYRMVNPYGTSSESPIASSNRSDVEFDIVFDISDPDCVIFYVQNSGFMMSTEFKYICNRAGLILEQGQDLTDEVKNQIAKDGYRSEYYDGEITVNKPLYSEDEGSTWYNYRTNYPSVLYMPETDMSRAASNKINRMTGRDGEYTYQPDGIQLPLKRIPVRINKY